MMELNPISLSEHVALLPMICHLCDGDIEIGDDCFVDSSAGIEESQAIIYCFGCVEQYFDS